MGVDIDRLAPNSYQPRSRTEDARIDDLARSIKANGVIQPILVHPKGAGYQIIQSRIAIGSRGGSSGIASASGWPT